MRHGVKTSRRSELAAYLPRRRGGRKDRGWPRVRLATPSARVVPRWGYPRTRSTSPFLRCSNLELYDEIYGRWRADGTERMDRRTDGRMDGWTDGRAGLAGSTVANDTSRYRVRRCHKETPPPATPLTIGVCESGDRTRTLTAITRTSRREGDIYIYIIRRKVNSRSSPTRTTSTDVPRRNRGRRDKVPPREGLHSGESTSEGDRAELLIGIGSAMPSVPRGPEKISTHRHSVPLARPVSPCKRCPPVPTSRMYADFTSYYNIEERSWEKKRAHERYLVVTTARNTHTKTPRSSKTYSHSQAH